MKRLLILMGLCSLVFIPSIPLPMPGVYPTGTIIFKPDKCWSGYTILSGFPGVTLFYMNGNVVEQWEGFDTMPNRVVSHKRCGWSGNIMIGRERATRWDITPLVWSPW